MLATAVRVQAEAEADIGAVVLREDGAARVAVEERRGVGALAVLIGIRIELDVQRLVAVRRVRDRAAPGEIGTHRAGLSPFLRFSARTYLLSTGRRRASAYRR